MTTTKFNTLTATMLALTIFLFTARTAVYAQETTAPPAGMPGMPGMAMGGSSGTANDLFVMAGPISTGRDCSRERITA